MIAPSKPLKALIIFSKANVSGATLYHNSATIELEKREYQVKRLYIKLTRGGVDFDALRAPYRQIWATAKRKFNNFSAATKLIWLYIVSLNFLALRIEIMRSSFSAHLIYSNTFVLPIDLILYAHLKRKLFGIQDQFIYQCHLSPKVAERIFSDRSTSRLNIDWTKVVYSSDTQRHQFEKFFGLGVEYIKLPLNYPYRDIVSQTDIETKIDCYPNKQEKIILGIGEPTSRKGIDIYWKIASHSRQKKLKIKFYWIGDDTKMTKNQLASYSECIKFAGVRSDVQEQLKSADLLICPSRDDLGPLVVKEAIENGLKVLCSDKVGLLTDYPAARPYIVSIDSPIPVWVEKMLQILGSKEKLTYKGEVMSDRWEIILGKNCIC